MTDDHQRTATQDIVDRAYGEDHLRDCMGYKSFGEWPCDCLIGDLCDEVEALRALVARAHRDSWSDEGEQMWACRGLVALSDEQVPVLLRALASGSSGDQTT